MGETIKGNESSKDNIKNIEWVKQSTRLELFAMRKEMKNNNLFEKIIGKSGFFKENEKGGITYDMKAVKDYLGWLAKNPDATGKLKTGSTVARTTCIQIALESFGFDVGRIDGIMGRGTKNAIRQFQQKCGLKVDGKAGSKTLEKLSESINALTFFQDSVDSLTRPIRRMFSSK